MARAKKWMLAEHHVVKPGWWLLVAYASLAVTVAHGIVSVMP